jgi:hypothetical protein
MQIPVLVERIGRNEFRAKAGEPFALSAEGRTHEDALRNLRQLIDSKLSAGTELACLDIPTNHNPWLRMAGCWDPDDPMVQQWKEILKENRRKADEDPDYR